MFALLLLLVPAAAAHAPAGARGRYARQDTSLLSVNPTAVPLASITGNMPSSSTIPLSSTAPPGATPTGIPGAPGIPDVTAMDWSKYPDLDVTPDVTSPEVQQWIQEVANSGIHIPNITVTVDGGCPANPEAVADNSRCWWTCGGCTRDTDVTDCPNKLTWGVTYDDGPGEYTPNLLDFLEDKDISATFFSIGSRALERPVTLQAEYMAGHQIGVHTWSHPPLTTKTNEEVIAELGWARKVIKDIIGLTPNTMRPPYGDIDDRVRNISLALGLTPVMWTRISPLATFDTNDFELAGGTTTPQQVIQSWDDILGNATTINSGFIVLEHDLFQQTVDIATGYILPDALAFQPALKLMPVVQCMGMPLANSYMETNNNATNPPVRGGVVASTTMGSTTTAATTRSSSTVSSAGFTTTGSNQASRAAAKPGVATAAIVVSFIAWFASMTL